MIAIIRGLWRSSAVLALVGLMGCSTLSGVATLAQVTGLNDLGKPTTSLSTVALSSDSDVNDLQAVMLDLVFVMDETTAAQLPDNSVDWFNQRQQLQGRFGPKLSLASLQVPPGYDIKDVVLPKNYGSAVRVLLYANYLNKEAQVALDITQYTDLYLELRKDSVALTEQPGWSLW